MKVNVMMEYKDGASEKYETHEVSTIIDTPEENHRWQEILKWSRGK